MVTTYIRHRSSYDTILQPFIWHIPDIYHMRKVYIWHMSGIYLSYVLYLRLDINQVYVRYTGLVMTLIFLTSESRHPLHLLMWQWTARFEVFENSTYWAQGPDPNRCGTDWKNRPEADVSIAFIGPVRCLNTNGMLKHQLHWLNTNGTFRFFNLNFKTRLKLRAATQDNEQGP